MELGLGRAYAMLAAGLPVLNRATTDGGRFLLPDWDTFLSLPGTHARTNARMDACMHR